MSETSERIELGQRLLREVLDPMKRTFIGKDEVVDLLGVCLLAGENLFLLGPPGTAKSALVHELGRRLEGRTFEYLLTRFTEPSEIFGPFDIRRLREGELVTNIEGMLPEASLVFLDELFNANSAILNSLLGALNERTFRRGKETLPLPVLMVVGASNHLPSDDALAALFDRFLLRVRCDNVALERLREVLRAGWDLDMGRTNRQARLGIEEVLRLHGMLGSVDLDPILGTYVETVGRLRQAGIPISDRRAVKLQRLVAASALLCGRSVSAVSDLWVLRYIWEVEEQQEVLSTVVQEAIARAPRDGSDHPRARGADAPDPESLVRGLDEIARKFVEGDVSAGDLACLRDQLRILASRCQWVQEEQQRTFLLTRVGELWDRLGRTL